MSTSRPLSPNRVAVKNAPSAAHRVWSATRFGYLAVIDLADNRVHASARFDDVDIGKV